ncbi:hypothetical protein SRB5_17660 [Streptomyces sp. RB5]|uniref:Uncharacterized protein n=1 Tax=Streptomyces smaragdinus TaxID=2585196 RepID=A0A7K0CDV2_9ACTN|nr:hypothetical protein [Streptomyces smaragdinus]MQY11647.1 hypothetical protein [Streptomyces smaragdinus]
MCPDITRNLQQTGQLSRAWFHAADRPAPADLRTLDQHGITAALHRALRGPGISLRSPLPAGPLVLPRSSYDELFDLTRAMLGLCRRAVLALAPTWPARLEALGAQPEDHPLLSALDTTETEYCTLMASADFTVGPQGAPQLLRMHAAGDIRGVAETAAFTGVWQRAHRPGAFFGHDPVGRRARSVGEVCAARGLARSAAFLGGPRSGARPDAPYGEADAERMRGCGFTTDFVEPAELPDALGPPGAPRYSVVLDNGAATPAALRRGLLLPPAGSALLADPRTLALVSAGLPWLTRREERLVRRHLPWTRMTLPGRTRWRDEECELPDVLLRHQQQFVLRPGHPAGSRTLVGCHTAAGVWARAVDEAFTHGSGVVQEYVEPAAVTVELTDGEVLYPASVAPVLTAMLFAGRPGGCWARFTVADRGRAENAVLAWE